EDRAALSRLWTLAANAHPQVPPAVPDRKAATWARIHAATSGPDLTEAPVEEREALAQLWNAARFAHPSAPPVNPDRKSATWAQVLAALRLSPAETAPDAQATLPAAPYTRTDRAPKARARSWRRYAPFVAPALILLMALGSLWGFLPQTVTAPAGRTQTVRLADGSTVALSGGSSLTNTRWNPRAVRLEGIAFFDVADDAARPFTVDAPGTTVRVLGTAFEVNATGLPGTTASVTVARGRVAVSAPDTPREVQVTAGQRVLLDGDVGAPEAYTGPVAAWRSGAFRFDDAPLADVFAAAGTRFGTSIKVPEAVGDRRWTVELAHPANVEDVLEAVCTPLGLRFRPVEGGYEVFVP
ncbi:MAG TPA: FecR domain-containing protein, partial [Rhodothermales bacterium]|nr:FecR domain-containing protein [Rhodothermales bacterium]